MNSDSDYENDVLDLPDDAPEADVLEQYQSTELDEDEDTSAEVPAEADPADVEEQRRSVGGTDEDDYR